VVEGGGTLMAVDQTAGLEQDRLHELVFAFAVLDTFFVKALAVGESHRSSLGGQVRSPVACGGSFDKSLKHTVFETVAWDFTFWGIGVEDFGLVSGNAALGGGCKLAGEGVHDGYEFTADPVSRVEIYDDRVDEHSGRLGILSENKTFGFLSIKIKAEGDQNQDAAAEDETALAFEAGFAEQVFKGSV